MKKITKSNIKGFMQGWSRKLLEEFPGFVPDYIYEQIHFRLGIMDEQCIINKECPCECSVPAKQYEDRPCENNCYPPMMKENEWEEFKLKAGITIDTIQENLYKRKDILFND